jgi:hypothetical protein
MTVIHTLFIGTPGFLGGFWCTNLYNDISLWMLNQKLIFCLNCKSESWLCFSEARSFFWNVESELSLSDSIWFLITKREMRLNLRSLIWSVYLCSVFLLRKTITWWKILFQYWCSQNIQMSHYYMPYFTGWFLYIKIKNFIWIYTLRAFLEKLQLF